MGGSPFRLMRLSEGGSRLLDRWLTTGAGDLAPNERVLWDRLLDASMVHPVADTTETLPPVSFVIPVYGDANGLAECLEAVRAEFTDVSIVVVDDASTNAVEIAEIATAHQAQLLRHAVNRGPAAARNTGWRSVADECQVVWFLDADVVPEPGALALTLAHFADPAVSVSAPRVRSRAGDRLIDSYETMNSPLDLGDRPALVRPGNWPSYVPSAALAIRSSALRDTDGFDDTMRFGEDVDLLWRLSASGNVIRYEPRAVVRHRNRSSFRAWLGQRFGYGSSAGPLATRHGDTVTPLRLPLAMCASWMAALFGGRAGLFAALIAGGFSISKLSAKLDGKVDRPSVEAARLVVRAQTGVGGALVNAVTRNYAPLFMLHRQMRRRLGVMLLVPPLIAWVRARPGHNPIVHVALKTMDDAAYGAGVWTGALRERSVAALLPDVYLSKNNDD